MTTVTADTSSELLSAIQELGAGDYIETGKDVAYTDIPANTTLDGEGVTVVCNHPSSYLLRPSRRGITIQNIRFIGPKYGEVREYGWWDYEVSGTAWNYAAAAMKIQHSDVMVRHCEFSGWTHAGICVGENSGDATLSPHIYGNKLVDNNCRALGYGVVVMGGDPLIEYNYFNNNRHDIAGGDWEGVSYEARYNHVGEVGRIYGFECHPPGGRRIHVHHNTFEDKHGNTPRKGRGRQVLIRNRGVPSDEAIVENNWFKGRMTTKMSDEAREKYTFRDNHEGPDVPAEDIGQPRPPEIEAGVNVDADLGEVPTTTRLPRKRGFPRSRGEAMLSLLGE